MATLDDLLFKTRKQAEQIQKIFKWMQLVGSPKELLDRVTSIEALIKAMKHPTFREQTIQEAAWTVPRTYSILFEFAAQDTAEQTLAATIDQEGWFFLERIRASWRLTDGQDAGRFQGLSSGNPVIVASTAGGGAFPTNMLDFLWEYQEGRSQRGRMDRPLPGDILYRNDRDGYVAGSDAFGPNAAVQFTITPTRAVETDGILQIMLEGIQCLKVLKQ